MEGGESQTQLVQLNASEPQLEDFNPDDADYETTKQLIQKTAM